MSCETECLNRRIQRYNTLRAKTRETEHENMRILMTMFGWQESGGGTILPRQIALGLQRRGHQVMVIYASTEHIPNAPAYTLSERSEEGVQLIGIHNWGLMIKNWVTAYLGGTNPEHEIENPAVWDIFRVYLNKFQPDIVHYHNFYALSMGFTDLPRAQNLPTFFTLHNFWLLCPTLYLYYQNQEVCAGVNETGSNCSQCTQSFFRGSLFTERRDRLREKAHTDLTRLFVSAPKIKEMLEAQGYWPEKIEVLKLGNLRAVRIWEGLGQKRAPFQGPTIRFGFMGSLLPVKGIHILFQAVQLLKGDFSVHVYGEAYPEQLDYLKSMDPLNRIRLEGSFKAEEQLAVLEKIDVGIVPSSCHEQAGMAVEEFLSGGVPVIVSDRGGLSYYLQPGTGAIFEADQPQRLAEVMQALIDQPEQICIWQAQIQAPVSFEQYIQAMESRYHETVLNHKSQDLHNRLAAEPGLNTGSEPDSESHFKILLVLDASEAWQPVLKSFLASFQAHDPLELVLLPQNLSSQAAQDLLLDWLESEGLDAESGPELLLLEPMEDLLELQALLSVVQVYFWSETAFQTNELALKAGLPLAGSALPAELKSATSPALVQDWLLKLGFSYFPGKS
ncbi:hypothetical protein COW36_01705 [bacterium (Candidatus Blackallbacteria) CG17_big_fil_post_rev_8_21_14_2_50_48_46]|uniref:Glycosyltransferase subfamily 4-like N-terminal domain-containing protein n=1 Tax=bacterium (Candidatus Blackallbacteria) CG17_big_fil_post_rev_8_21_14_2_50_48_46 TaxID=2014261 RepID=A0A2M7GAG6_9BACT|nr:MAG: hypothetical protein COW64_26095 [bacterium (Candidatus Blackallbacteria) CG18_big_fil_WC_8_21_14_2_50_49_26]PIW19152.1 MAG: hypothetical protein COW36_01705 [bacterium (Candidatus Blackallbacteria) CG17_big_fil_post_rev_8_21_14_2_50_48_46]PIW45497.1 MAG: hypothetical protein COW20_20435 [bacterium (Candidatus Blackallbacteria) CG13_big_fil_rev_8_21_14_2_50_49_14]